MSHKQMLYVNRNDHGEFYMTKINYYLHIKPVVGAKITLNKIMAEINAEFCLTAL